MRASSSVTWEVGVELWTSWCSSVAKNLCRELIGVGYEELERV
jgi:hypothetical protein